MDTLQDIDGRTLAILPPRTTDKLHAAFNAQATTYPDTHQSNNSKDFLTELRHTCDRLGLKDTFLPDPALTALWKTTTTHFHIHNDRNCSVLDALPEATRIWTNHPRDILYGAQHDPKSSPITGNSRLTITNEKDFPLLYWASLSATHSPAPTITLTLLPTTLATQYITSTDDPNTTIIASFTKTALGNHPKNTYTNSINARSSLIATCNRAGAQTLRQSIPRWETDLRQVLRIRPQDMTSHDLTWWAPHAYNPDTPPPRRIETAQHPDRTKPWQWTTQRRSNSPATSQPTPRTPLPRTTHAKPVAYTDGSVTTTTPTTTPHQGDTPVGGGVYIHHPTSAPAQHSLTIQHPCPTSKVNASELATIDWTLMNTSATTIATDSLVSLYQIDKYIRSPDLFNIHPHKHILSSINQSLLLRARAGQHTSLVKVRAHSGIPGNEHADHLANIGRTPNQTNVTHDAKWTPPPTG